MDTLIGLSYNSSQTLEAIQVSLRSVFGIGKNNKLYFLMEQRFCYFLLQFEVVICMKEVSFHCLIFSILKSIIFYFLIHVIFTSENNVCKVCYML
jgi:hypothetical protein